MDYDIRAEGVEEAVRLTPGIESPTVSPLHDKGWVAVRAMVPRRRPTRSWTSCGRSAPAASSSPTSTPAGCERSRRSRAHGVPAGARPGRRLRRGAAAVLVTLVALAVALPSGGPHPWGLGSRLGVVPSPLAVVRAAPAGRRPGGDLRRRVLVVNVVGRRRLEWAEVVGVRLLPGRPVDAARPLRRAGAGGDGRAEVRGGAGPAAGPGVRPDGHRAHPGRRPRVAGGQIELTDAEARVPAQVDRGPAGDHRVGNEVDHEVTVDDRDVIDGARVIRLSPLGPRRCSVVPRPVEVAASRSPHGVGWWASPGSRRTPPAPVSTSRSYGAGSNGHETRLPSRANAAATTRVPADAR